MFKRRHATIFVGFPGVGKTYFSRKICKQTKAVPIEQDSFYVGGKCDTQSYLEEIEKTVQHNNVVLCKNHHTKQSLDEVLGVLKRNRVD